jgi:hypothetical protein
MSGNKPASAATDGLEQLPLTEWVNTSDQQ